MCCHRPTVAIVHTIWGHGKWKRNWKLRIWEMLEVWESRQQNRSPTILKVASYRSDECRIIGDGSELSRAVCWQQSVLALSWSISAGTFTCAACKSCSMYAAILVWVHTLNSAQEESIWLWKKCIYKKGALNNPNYDSITRALRAHTCTSPAP